MDAISMMLAGYSTLNLERLMVISDLQVVVSILPVLPGGTLGVRLEIKFHGEQVIFLPVGAKIPRQQELHQIWYDAANEMDVR